jgi:hypothetical protein
MNSKEKLVAAINDGAIPNSVCEILLALTEEHLSKGDLILLAYGEEKSHKVDSAYPEQYANLIREVIPGWRGSFACYDYNRLSLGQMENVAELTILRIQDLMRAHIYNFFEEKGED